jgi:hypothetical protein
MLIISLSLIIGFYLIFTAGRPVNPVISGGAFAVAPQLAFIKNFCVLYAIKVFTGFAPGIFGAGAMCRYHGVIVEAAGFVFQRPRRLRVAE